MSTPALEFEHVSKSFNSTTNIVDDLSLTVQSGEFFSILGPSGCGKTTCLRMISGLEKPTQGIIRMNGKVVNDVHAHQRNVHMVFQKYALFPHLTIFENIAFGLRIKKISEREIKDRVTRMLKMVSLGGFENRKPAQLSGGEQQRVALTRALVNEPSILLLDEPLGALDLKLREQMQLELSNIQKNLGITFIFVTHDQWEALTLSNRIAIMNKGKIEQVGTPAEVYEKPVSLFAAKFVGTTNTFIDSLQTTVIRPEKINIQRNRPESVKNAFHCKVLDKTYFGPNTQIRVTIESKNEPITILRTNAHRTIQENFDIGESVYIFWQDEDCTVLKNEKA